MRTLTIATLALTLMPAASVFAASTAVAASACVPSAHVVGPVTSTGETSNFRALRTRTKIQPRKRRVHATVTVWTRVRTTWNLVAPVEVTRCPDGIASIARETVRFSLASSTDRRAVKASVAKSRKNATRQARAAAKQTSRSAALSVNRLAISRHARGAAETQAAHLVARGREKDRIRAAVFVEINKRRAEHGLPALKYLLQAEPLADDWVETVKDGPFRHDPDWLGDLASLGCNPPSDGFPPDGSENLHFGAHGTPTQIAVQAVKWWMNSPGHRAALLNEWNVWSAIGAAYSTQGEYWALVFRATTEDCSNL